MYYFMILHDKRCQDLSINTVILGVIAILVLVVLIVIVSGDLGKQNRTLRSTTTGSRYIYTALISNNIPVSKLKNDIKNKGTISGCNQVLWDYKLTSMKCVNTTSNSNCWNTGVSAGKSGSKEYYFFICRR